MRSLRDPVGTYLRTTIIPVRERLWSYNTAVSLPASPPALGGVGEGQPHPQAWEGGGHGSLTPSPGREGGMAASPPALGGVGERQPHPQPWERWRRDSLT